MYENIQRNHEKAFTVLNSDNMQNTKRDKILNSSTCKQQNGAT